MKEKHVDYKELETMIIGFMYMLKDKNKFTIKEVNVFIEALKHGESEWVN